MEGGPSEFTPDFTWPALLGRTPGGIIVFAYRTITFYGPIFQYGSTNKTLCNSLAVLQHGMVLPITPSSKRLQASMSLVWADSLSLAATGEVEVSFLSWGY